jgi:hypothetical protein
MDRLKPSHRGQRPLLRGASRSETAPGSIAFRDRSYGAHRGESAFKKPSGFFSRAAASAPLPSWPCFGRWTDGPFLAKQRVVPAGGTPSVFLELWERSPTAMDRLKPSYRGQRPLLRGASRSETAPTGRIAVRDRFYGEHGGQRPLLRGASRFETVPAGDCGISAVQHKHNRSGSRSTKPVSTIAVKARAHRGPRPRAFKRSIN